MTPCREFDRPFPNRFSHEKLRRVSAKYRVMGDDDADDDECRAGDRETLPAPSPPPGIIGVIAENPA
jgi:hypothetical protein